jgi:outer membrane protein TolC
MPKSFLFMKILQRTLPIAALALAGGTALGHAQGTPSAPANSTAPTAASFQGSVTSGVATQDTISLTLDDAVERGMRNNLGLLLSSTQIANARGQRLEELQSLLPAVDGSINESLMQSDLAAQGLRIPGFPSIIGPFGFTDLRIKLSWSLVDLASLHNYMAARHNFRATQLTAEDARQMVILTVGNAYLLVLADQAEVDSAQAEVDTAQVSLNQAVANHEAGTAPRLDELRARVDFQSQQQQLIVAKNQLAKDRLALSRVIGMPLDQKYDLADKAPYGAFDQPEIQASIELALKNRKDRQAVAEQTLAATEQRKAATAERLPTLKADADYGDIGVNVNHSHGTGNAAGTITIPIFKEAQFRGDATITQAQLEIARDQQSDLDAQIEADIRDSLLDISSSQKQVEVARSNAELAREALSEAQQRYAAGVSDNLGVSEAQQSVAQADGQYISSLYRHNVAKLNLARSLGVAQNFKEYLGGK